MQDPNIYDYKINDQQAEFLEKYTFDGDIPYQLDHSMTKHTTKLCLKVHSLILS